MPKRPTAKLRPRTAKGTGTTARPKRPDPAPSPTKDNAFRRRRQGRRRTPAGPLAAASAGHHPAFTASAPQSTSTSPFLRRRKKSAGITNYSSQSGSGCPSHYRKCAPSGPSLRNLRTFCRLLPPRSRSKSLSYAGGSSSNRYRYYGGNAWSTSVASIITPHPPNSRSYFRYSIERRSGKRSSSSSHLSRPTSTSD